jgi:hypothetical protein
VESLLGPPRAVEAEREEERRELVVEAGMRPSLLLCVLREETLLRLPLCRDGILKADLRVMLKVAMILMTRRTCEVRENGWCGLEWKRKSR